MASALGVHVDDGHARAATGCFEGRGETGDARAHHDDVRPGGGHVPICRNIMVFDAACEQDQRQADDGSSHRDSS